MGFTGIQLKHNMEMKKLLLLVITLFPFSSLLANNGQSDESKVFTHNVRRIMQEYDAVGVSVVLIKNNEISFSQSFGYNPSFSNPQARDSIRSNDLFYMASISKTFVATAIMQLVEKGVIALDDSVNHYLDFPITNPYYPNIPITIRMLLCHRSSLNDIDTYQNFDNLRPEINSDYKSFYKEYEPGANYNYSNLGYNLLAAIIEKVTGLRFDLYIDNNIMKPLNLYGGYDITKLDSSRFVRTRRYNKETKKFVNVKTAYFYDEEIIDNYVLGYNVSSLRPAGGMKISATDLATFMLVHMNEGKYKDGKRILSKHSEHEMRKVQKGNKGYGLGLSHYDNIIPHEDLIGNTGGARGSHTAMFFHPKRKYGFVVICNGCTSKSANGIEMNKKIVREMYNCFIKSDM